MRPVVLGLLAGTSGAAVLVVLAVAPEAGATLGMRSTSVTTLALAQALAVAAAALTAAVLVHDGRRPGHVALLAALTGVGTTALLATVTVAAGLVDLLAINALAAGAALALHPLLARAGSVRAVAVHRAAAGTGLAGTLALVAATAGTLTWRGMLLAAAGLAAAAVAVAVVPLLRAPAAAADTLALSFGERARGAARAPTLRRVLRAQAALGVVAVPLVLFALLWLEDRWTLGLPERLGVLAGAIAVAATVPLLLAGEGERRIAAHGPGALLAAAGGAAATAAAALLLTLVPVFGVAVAALTATLAALAVAHAALEVVAIAVVDESARPHSAALCGASAAGIGGVIGVLISAGLVGDIGAGPALAALALPALTAALALRGGSEEAAADTDAVAVRADEDAAVRAARHHPLLAARGLVMHYGHRRAIDGVDLAVEEGELLALLGTNGAGKSTLLRGLSGLLAPTAGSVRLEGRDITLLDPERRYALGIGHVAAGAAVFDSLKVHESLRLAAHAGGLRPGDAAAAPDWAFSRFPRLAERRDGRVAALSGGERQMLALAQILIGRPRILLVDELSLGLAPGVIADLLEVVRDVNRDGTTVIVVEQSVDLALGLAHRAVFLERGRVRFDGAPTALRARDDLLRPVFLAHRTVAGTAR